MEGIDDPLETTGYSLLALALPISFVAMGSCFRKKRISILAPAPSPTPATPSSILEDPCPLCNEEERKIVQEIFTRIASGLFVMTTSAFHLKKLGNQIAHIHPFSFLEATPIDKAQKIFREGSLLAKKGVLGGIVPSLERHRDTLSCYLPSFARTMNKDPATLQQLIRAADWEAFAKHVYGI